MLLLAWNRHTGRRVRNLLWLLLMGPSVLLLISSLLLLLTVHRRTRTRTRTCTVCLDIPPQFPMQRFLPLLFMSISRRSREWSRPQLPGSNPTSTHADSPKLRIARRDLATLVRAAVGLHIIVRKRIALAIRVREMHDPTIMVRRWILVITSRSCWMGLRVEEGRPVEGGREARDDGVALGVRASSEGAGGAGEDVAGGRFAEGLVGGEEELVVDDVRVDDAEGGLGVDEDFGVGLGVAGVHGGHVGVVIGLEEGGVGLGGEGGLAG